MPRPAHGWIGACIFAPLIGLWLYGLVVFAGLMWPVPARGHDHPISGKKNAAGEWCCGEGDCFAVPKVVFYTPPFDPAFYMLFRQGDAEPFEYVPEGEAMPSPDGQFWRCQRPDGTRRCFFAPPPGS